MKTGLTRKEMTTDVWYNEKEPMVHVRTHYTALKKRITDYAVKYPEVCRQIDCDPETGCMEFEIEKGRLAFRLTAPYSDERREAARQYARKNNIADRLK